MISIVEGNIFNLLENNSVLIHQTNCMGVMGAGIAKTVKYKFSEEENTTVSSSLECVDIDLSSAA